MDTKLKKFKDNKSKKIIANVIVVIILLMTSLGVMTTYKTADDNNAVDKNALNKEVAAEYFANQLYPMYWSMKQETEGSKRPSDVFMSDKKAQEMLDSVDTSVGNAEVIGGTVGKNGKLILNKDNIKRDFDEEFESTIYSDLISSSRNEKARYNIYNKSNNRIIGNDKEELNFIKDAAFGAKIENDVSVSDNSTKGMSSYEIEEKMKEMNSKYLFYMVIDFDQDGNANILSLHGADKSVYQNVVNYHSVEGKVYSTNLFEKYKDKRLEYKLEPIKNTVMTVGITKEGANGLVASAYDDSGRYNGLYNILASNKTQVLNQIAMVGVILVCVYAVLGILMPNVIRNDIFAMSSVIKIPIEIIVLLAGMACAAYISVNPIMFVNLSVSEGVIIELTNLIPISDSLASGIVVFANILYWFVLFAISLMGGIYLRDILSKKDRKVIFNSSIMVRVMKWIVSKIRAFFRWMNNLDLKDGYEKFIFIALGINLLAITISSTLWGFGIITGAVYTVVLYILIKKKWGKVLEDYNKLEKITSDIANGDFGAVPEENLGIFNPIKENLENIEIGFSAAVNEEVKSQKMKTELITNVSHDLKTPLTSIITYVDLLKKEGITEEERAKYLETIEKKSNRLKFLIEDLFEVSKATSGNVTMHPMKIDVVSLVKQTILELEDKINATHLEIRTRFPEEKVILELDSMRTFRIFSNLISNIAKYSMPYTRVYIDVRRNEETTEIEFKNISAQELNCDVENLTERFVRGDKSRNTEGSGLGLAIAKSFTELQDGKMNISSDGDLFKVVLVFKNERNLKKEEVNN